MPRKPITIHEHVSLILCDSAASLAEVRATVDLSDVPHQQFGDRAIIVPVHAAAGIVTCLHEAGIYPRLTGDLHDPELK